MVRSEINLGQIRDYILEYFPDLLWWDGYRKHEVFDKRRSYKHRQGMPNEIRIEFDSKDTQKNWEDINFTAIALNERGLSFAIYYVEGGRSPHIHIYDLDELETLNYEQRNQYRRLFLGLVCPHGSNPDYSLCDEKHLCALEFVNHFKYNKPKELLHHFWNGRNQGIDFDIKMDILHGKKKIEKKPNVKEQVKLGDMLKMDKRDLIIRHCEFEKVFEKYNVPYKNKMALCPFHADKDKSLSFSNEKGLWKCWGCDKKGDVITLIKLLREAKNGDKK